MTQYRRMDKDTTRDFLHQCGWHYVSGFKPCFSIKEYSNEGSLRSALLGGLDTIHHPDIPAPLKELLRAAIREQEHVCIRDKLKSRRAKGLSTGALFSCTLVGSLSALSDETIYNVY